MSVQEVESDGGYRIFVLGAGFSVPAGLPMAADLSSEVRNLIEDNFGTDSRFHRDLNSYVEYVRECEGREIDRDSVDLEALLEYLDVEHYLGLRGGDTWGEEGNEGQVLIKQFIGQVIQQRTPAQEKLPNIYYEFANGLQTTDIVVTFNYDTVLESALEEVGKPYRLFPERYSKIGEFFNELDESRSEIALLKMHGSVDWFSKKSYDRQLAAFRRRGDFRNKPRDPIFSDETVYNPRKIVDGPREMGDPLSDIYRISNAERFYSRGCPPATPFLISPSPMKIVYTTPFLGFWFGMGKAGAFNLGVSIIGFSLPEHDSYARVALHKIVSNYQGAFWGNKFLGNTYKDFVRLVDYQPSPAGRESYLKRYAFIDPDRMRAHLDGFDHAAIEFLFKNPRTS